jgi:hypothetical protein
VTLAQDEQYTKIKFDTSPNTCYTLLEINSKQEEAVRFSPYGNASKVNKAM